MTYLETYQSDLIVKVSTHSYCKILLSNLFSIVIISGNTPSKTWWNETCKASEYIFSQPHFTLRYKLLLINKVMLGNKVMLSPTKCNLTNPIETQSSLFNLMEYMEFNVSY